MKKRWFKNGKRIILDGRQPLCKECPCGKWVIGGDYYNVAYSSSGIDWKLASNPISATYGIATNGSMWVGVGDGNNPRIISSTDGINWTLRVNYGTGYITRVSWNGSMWIAVGYGDYEIWRSTDGINWTGISLDSLNIPSVLSIAWNGSIWVAGALKNNSPSVIVSSDGINWTSYDAPGYILDVAYNGSIWVGTNSTSPDGINWTARDGVTWGIVWNGEFWLGAKAGYANIYKSYDGITWFISGSISSTTINDIAWNGKLFVATGMIGTSAFVATSIDGEVWITRGGYLSSQGRCIASIPAPNIYPPIL